MAYRLEPDGLLSLINSQRRPAVVRVYVAIDASGRVALVAHYASGSVVSLPIAEDGSLSPVSQLHQHAGTGPRSDRQDGPHAHCILADPSNRFACAVDLGLDQVVSYALDVSAGRMAGVPASVYHAAAGSGPRHLVFHPDGRTAFLIHELDSTLTLLLGRRARRAGNLAYDQHLPDGYQARALPQMCWFIPTASLFTVPIADMTVWWYANTMLTLAA